MPHTVESTAGRIILISTVALVVVLFSLWFSTAGRLWGNAPPEQKNQAPIDQQEAPHRVQPMEVTPYPALHREPHGDASVHYGAEPDFDPPGTSRTSPTRKRALRDLLRLLPEGSSLLAMVDITRLRRWPWAADLLAGRKLSRLRTSLERLGLDPSHAHRVVFGIDLEARSGTSTDKVDRRFLGSYDRPFTLVAEGPMDRKSILKQFRKWGPLAASMVLGRRVYRRLGDYALTFPVHGMAAWSYRRPMGPLLQSMLEDTSRTVLKGPVVSVLREGTPRDKGPPPVITLVWTPQAKRRIPFPFNRIGGYGPRTSLRGAVLTVSPVSGRPGNIQGALRFIYRDIHTPPQMALLLRYVRRYVSQNARIRRAKLHDLVQSTVIAVRGHQIQVSLELYPWHISAMIVMFHKLLES